MPNVVNDTAASGSAAPGPNRVAPAEPPGSTGRRRLRRLVIAAVVAAALPPILALVLWSRCGLSGCPDVARLGAYRPEGAPLVVDRNGAEIGQLELAAQPLVELADLPEFVGEAFLAVEDKRFHEHDGVDWRRVVGAAVANVRAGGVREGSSTVTMQLARNVFSDRLAANRRTFGRKILEARTAMEIEGAYSKDEILELYLNHIYFGGGKRGIAAAAQYYFRKPATELTLREAALLAALPKGPTRYDPREHPERARERRDLVLQLMADQRRVSAADAADAQGSSLGVARRGRSVDGEEPFAEYFLEKVREELEERFGDALYRERLRIVTTLDRAAQESAERELSRQLTAVEDGAWGRFSGVRYGSDVLGDERGTPYLQGAVVLLEARTGDVLAWVGGRDFAHSRFDRVEQASRQMGSIFKPFVYAAAIAGGIPPTQRFSDLPLTVELAGGKVWEPRNFDGWYAASVSLRDALVDSRNLATLRVAEAAGMRRAARLGESAGLPEVSGVPAAALGTDEVSPLQIATAYTPFASLGDRVTPRWVLRVEDAAGELLWEAPEPELERVLDPAVAFVVTDLLRDAVQRGTGEAAHRAGVGVPLAGKTGTTNDYQDVWFVGYTPDIVGTVWMGFDRPQPVVPRASGGRLAAPVLGRILRDVYQHRDHPGGWPLPEGAVLGQVDAATGQLVPPGCGARSGRTFTEVFLVDHQPEAVCPGREPGILASFFGWLPHDAPPPDAAPNEEVVVIPEDEISPAGELSPRARELLRNAERRLRERVEAEGRRDRRERRDAGRAGRGEGRSEREKGKNRDRDRKRRDG